MITRAGVNWYTDATRRYAGLAQQGRQAVADAARAWTRTVQEAFSDVPKSAAEFDFAEASFADATKLGGSRRPSRPTQSDPPLLEVP
jgi:hypothetical protein